MIGWLGKIFRPLLRLSPMTKSGAVVPNDCEENDEEAHHESSSPGDRRPRQKHSNIRQKTPSPSSTRTQSLFDLQRTNETTFWRSYQALERLKSVEVGLIKSALRWLAQQTIAPYIFRSINYPIVEDNDREFWWFFLRRTSVIGLCVFALNVLSMLCFVGVVLMFTREGNENNKHYCTDEHFPRAELLTFLGRFMIPWLMLSILCGIFFIFVVLIERWPSLRRLMSPTQLLSLWRIFAATILFVRFIVLVSNAVWSLMQHSDTGGDSCPESYYLSQISQGSLQGELFLIMAAFEMSQIAFVALLSYPYPWILRVSVVEVCAMLIRVKTCAHIFGDFPMKKNFIFGVVTVVVAFYIPCVSIPIMSFEGSMRSSFVNIKRQQVAASEKMQVINMLCQEIKLPAQKLLQSLQSMVGNFKIVSNFSNVSSLPAVNSFCSASSPSNPTISLDLKMLISDAKRINATLNTVVDDLLFLAKVEEKRFTMHFQDLIVFDELMKDTTELLCHSLGISLPSQGSRKQSYPRIVTHYQQPHHPKFSTNLCVCSLAVDSVYSQQQCMRVILRLSFLALLLLRCEDKADHIPQYLATISSINQDSSITHDSVPFSVSISPVNHPQHGKLSPRKCDVVRFSIHLHREESPRYVNQSEKTKERLDLKAKQTIPLGGSLESACLVCRKIADATKGGSWQIYRDHVEFTLPCFFLAEDTYSNKRTNDIATDSVNIERDASEMESGNVANGDVFDFTESVHSLGTESFEEAKTLRSGKRKHKKRNSFPTTSRKRAARTLLPPDQCCVYLTDPPLELAVMDVVHALWSKSAAAEVTVLRQANLTIAHLKTFSILFVQSIQACQELRAKKFTGTLILLSERLAYLDMDERRCFDYGVALPFQLDALAQLSNALSQLHYISTKQNLPNRIPSTVGKMKITHSPSYQFYIRKRSSFLAFSPNREESRTFSRVFGWLLQSFRYDGGFPSGSSWKSVPRDRLESFFMWRSLVPLPNMLFHHSYSMGAASIVAILFYVTNYLNGLYPLITTLGCCVMGVFFYFRQSIFFRFLQPRRVTLVNVWAFLTIALNLLTIVRDLFSVNMLLGHLVGGDQSGKISSLSEFMESKKGVNLGSTFIFFVIIGQVAIRINSGSMPSSCGMLTCTVLYLRTTLLVVYIISPFISLLALRLYLVTFTTFLLLCYLLELFVHQCHAESFNSLYDLLLSKDFLDRALLLGRIQLSSSLKQQFALQNKVFELRAMQAIQFTVNQEVEEKGLSSVYYNSLFELRNNAYLSRDLIFQLHALGDRDFFAPWNRERLLSSMKSVLLHSTLNEICERLLVFCAPSTGASVRIFVKIDPSLTLVKLPVRLLSAVLFSSCKNLIHDILRQRSQSSSHNDDGALDIIFSVYPLVDANKCGGFSLSPSSSTPAASSMRFTDVRLMGIEIFSSLDCEDGFGWRGTPEDNTSTGVNGKKLLSHSLCNKYVRFFKLIQRNDTRTKLSRAFDRYRSIQRLLLPYFICPDSSKLHQLVDHVCFPSVNRVEHSSSIAFHRALKALREHALISKLQEKDPRADVSQWKRKAIVICDSESMQIGKLIGFKDIFIVNGWSCRVQFVSTLQQFIHVLFNERNSGSYDCIMLDIDFHTHFPTHESFQRLDAQDIVHFLRTMRYQGLIGIIDTLAGVEATDHRRYQRDRVRKMNPHVVAEKPDFFLMSLSDHQSGKIIEQAITQKIISKLINE